MSHQISTESGKAEIFTANTPAWHGLGVTTKGTQKWQDAMTLAGLDWAVEKRQLEYAGKPVGAYGIFRADTDRFLGAVGTKYVPIQNRDVFLMMDALVEAADGAHYESAGALGVGERIWALLNLPDRFIIKGTKDEHKVYLLGANNHDGSGVNRYKLTATRVVCNNTITAALSTDLATELRIRHTSGAKEKLEMARKALVGVRSELKTLQEKLNFLNSRRVTPETVTTVLTRLFPNIQTSVVQQNQAATVLLNFEDNDGDAFPTERGTAFSLVQAFTRWVDHQRTARINTLRSTEAAARGENALFGSGEEFKDNVLCVVAEVAATMPAASAAGVRSATKMPGLKVDSDIDAMLSEVGGNAGK